MKRDLLAQRRAVLLSSGALVTPQSSALLRKYADVALAITVLGLSALGCSSDGGISREEDTTTSGNQPGGSSYVPSGSGAPGGMQTETEMPVGTGPNLVVVDSWVDGATNGVEIQGAFFTYQDPTTRTIITPAAGGTGSGYCVSGTSAEVLDMNFSSTWGAVAALNLSQEAGSDAVGSYDATAHGVVGFGFDIVGDTSSALRFVVKQYMVHDGFCVNNVPDCGMGCSVEYRLDELTQNCWTAGGPSPNPASISALEWQITTKAGSETPFDYCIENLHALMGEIPASATPE